MSEHQLRHAAIFSTLPSISHFVFDSAYVEEDRFMRQKIYALRYEVYCLERNFLPAENYPDGLEFDEYDSYSTLFAACTHADEVIGTARLIQCPEELQFPFETHCNVLHERITLPPKHECGEVSRLIVHKNYRRRSGDSMEGIPREFVLNTLPAARANEPQPQPERRINSPEIMLGLYRQMYHYSLKAGVRYWYAAMERSLARVLRGFNFTFKPIGSESNYYGPVTPYIADLRELEDNLRTRNPALLAWFTPNGNHRETGRQGERRV